MKKLSVLFLVMVMLFTVTACGGETNTTAEGVSMVEITLEQGISMKLPSDMTVQADHTYLNT